MYGLCVAMTKFSIALLVLAPIAMGLTATSQANANLVTNGTFTSTTGGTATSATVNGTVYTGTTGQVLMTGSTYGNFAFNSTPGALPAVQLGGWYTYANAANSYSPFVFLAGPGTIFTTGFSDNWDNGYRTLWQGSAAASASLSPVGGNFLVMDPGYNVGTINQNISGLVSGASYTLSFWWAAAQWSQATGATQGNDLQATIGTTTFTTTPYNLPSGGFSGWMQATDTFVYSGSNNVLSFLAQSQTPGVPPSLLLAGVSLVQVTKVPEPSDLAVLGLGALGLIYARRRHRRA